MSGKNILELKVNNWSKFRAFTIAKLFYSENWTTLWFGDGRQRAFLQVSGFMVAITLVPSEERIFLVEGT